ncbi:MAG: hypothetical protein HY299_20965 [Verrucomicrobia bacterium]|nr:hypothetical protein [Verrucomicrobiota bacterium]
MNSIERASRYLARVPGAVSGQQGHNVTFHAASVLLHGFALTEGDALNLLTAWNQTCQPPWTPFELIHKVRSAAQAPPARPRGYMLGTESDRQRTATSFGPVVKLTRMPKPAFCPMVLRRLAAKAKSITDIDAYLAGVSATAINQVSSSMVLALLYPPGTGEKILIFSDLRSQGQVLWEADLADGGKEDRMPQGPEGVWFLPQPVDGLFHPNPRSGGKMSRRSEESVTAWRYVVLESDQAEREDWLRCLIQMPLRIACICDSGGRSVHALVRLDAANKAEWDTRVTLIKPTLITIGADPGALSAVRLTRLPQAMRGQRIQRLRYLNPHPTESPIINRQVALKETI